MASTQTIWGVIKADGSIAAGTGFDVIKPGTGQYNVSFVADFGSLPAVVGSQVQYGGIGEDTRDNVIFPFVVSSSFVAVTGDSGGKPVDRNFSFIAIGPAATP